MKERHPDVLIRLWNDRWFLNRARERYEQSTIGRNHVAPAKEGTKVVPGGLALNQAGSRKLPHPGIEGGNGSPSLEGQVRCASEDRAGKLEMSAYSTIKLSRGKALTLILEHLAKASDEDLASWVNDIIAGKLYNCEVGYEGDNDDDLV
jgi:hypothetical protein